MPLPRKFLVIDDVTDSRALVVRTLLRKFPSALIQECQESNTALLAASSEDYDLIIAHRTTDLDGLTTIRMLRKVSPTVPILMISGIDRSQEAIEAGATAFHSYDQWLLIGGVAAELIATGASVTASGSNGPQRPELSTALPRASAGR